MPHLNPSQTSTNPPSGSQASDSTSRDWDLAAYARPNQEVNTSFVHGITLLEFLSLCFFTTFRNLCMTFWPYRSIRIPASIPRRGLWLIIKAIIIRHSFQWTRHHSNHRQHPSFLPTVLRSWLILISASRPITSNGEDAFIFSLSNCLIIKIEMCAGHLYAIVLLVLGLEIPSNEYFRAWQQQARPTLTSGLRWV